MTAINPQAFKSSAMLPCISPSHTSFFSPEQIVRLQAQSNYTKVFPAVGKPFLMSKVLKDLEAILLPFGFVRTHRSHLINRKYIQKVSRNGFIIMQDLSKAEISKRKKKETMKELAQPYVN